MINLKKAMIVLAFTFMMGSFPSTTSACSCAEIPSVEEEFERAKAVFSGKVIDINDQSNLKFSTSTSVLFEVTNTWKGVEQSQIMITTGQGGGDCGYHFTKGKEYLVYAYESSMYGEKSLVTDICTGTGTLSSSQEDLMVLGEGHPPIEEVNVSGENDREVDVSEKNDRNQLYISVAIAVVLGMIVFFIFNKRQKRIND